jgi:hypothetical protein
MKTQREQKKRGKESREWDERQTERETERGSCLPNSIVRRNCILPAQHSTIFNSSLKISSCHSTDRQTVWLPSPHTCQMSRSSSVSVSFLMWRYWRNYETSCRLVGSPCPLLDHRALCWITVPSVGSPCPLWDHRALCVRTTSFKFAKTTGGFPQNVVLISVLLCYCRLHFSIP